MIPKIIHYCWFGRGKKPHLIRKCIKSWQKIMPDYVIKEWNEDNFNVNLIPFVSQAYSEKKWAFVADYCRFYALLKEGGVYLDTDVEVFRRFDDFLKHTFFSGLEYQDGGGWIRHSIDASVFGCEKNNPFAQEVLNYYSDKDFRNPDGSIHGGTVQGVVTTLAIKYGFKKENINQQLKNGLMIFDTSYFCNIYNEFDKRTIYSLHHFDGSWVEHSNRGRLYQFCRKHDLLHIYKTIEQIVK